MVHFQFDQEHQSVSNNVFYLLYFEIYCGARELYGSINTTQPHYGLQNTETPLRTPAVEIYSDFIIGFAKLSMDQRT